VRTASVSPRLYSLGSAFPAPPFRCTVHSVYPSALNLTIAGTGGLAVLVTRPDLSHPLSATVGSADGAAVRLDALGLSRGMTAGAERKTLVFANGLRFDLGAADKRAAAEERAPEAVDCTAALLRRRGQSLAKRQRAAATALSWSHLCGETGAPRSGQPQGDPLVRRFVAAAPQIRSALLADRPALAAEQARRLVGLGPGLTPAGDDFLCGLALAAWARTRLEVGHPAALAAGTVGRWLDLLLAAIDGAPLPLTGDVSRSFLEQARYGRFSRALVALAGAFTPAAVLRGDTDYETALDTLGRLGHSSGYDSATGFLFGLQGEGTHGN